MNKVSIIVPVFNVEKYLRKCLNSLVNQTLLEIEILVINDGSTDGSAKIIEEFQEKFPLKIKAFSKENGGLSDARNFGLDRADGEFIGFVDSDDEVYENMFEEMYSLAQRHSAEMVICNLQKVDENGNVTQKLTQIPNMPEKINLEENFSLFSDISYFACNKIFKKELFQNKRFKKEAHFEDIQLIPQLVLECKIIAQTQAYHYQYLERSDSITKTHTDKGLDILKAVEDVEVVFRNSVYSNKMKEWKNFQILEGVYSFLAYLAFVKDDQLYFKMSEELKKFVKKNNITASEIFSYQRFGKNYLLSLPIRKKIYYLLYFSRQEKLLRKLV
ncbi:glycosyltransferase family 2 protein [Kaistella sp. G5-32]|uniref:Glycosyltransferase family 2 protein n=1 Tax=Kaistella gelatinilytica TaxID=2787636 RepID=A0ABS0FCT1_9FLAO|nr:glycosyltransferase family 2 protein [Kaistella gelatinilytica]MBF8457485.1 glycosyltransferase family 2 protein [Kaistella gelatinilytica]